jgi:ribonuclease HI
MSTNDILSYFNTDNSTVDDIGYDIFTDGSEIKQRSTYKTLGLGWAFIVKRNRITMYEEVGNLPKGNNQRVELFALYKALQYIRQGSYDTSKTVRISMYTDSEYSQKCLMLWCFSWKRNGWMTSSKKPVKHQDIISSCMDMIDDLKKRQVIVRIMHVRSHTNRSDYLSLSNAEVDKLALQASKRMLNNI